MLEKSYRLKTRFLVSYFLKGQNIGRLHKHYLFKTLRKDELKVFVYKIPLFKISSFLQNFYTSCVMNKLCPLKVKIYGSYPLKTNTLNKNASSEDKKNDFREAKL